MPYAQINADGIAQSVTDQPIGIPCEWGDAGKRWTGSAFEDVAPAANWRITRLAFRNRFAAAEKVALYTAAETTAAVRVYLDDVAAATYVDLSRVDTVAGINALRDAGLLTAPRAAAILTTPPTADEVYRG